MMSLKKCILVPSILIFILCLTFGAAHAFTPIGDGVVWADSELPIKYVIDTDAFSDEEAAAIEKAFNTWGSISGSSLRFKRDPYHGEKLLDDPALNPVNLVTKSKFEELPLFYREPA
jgi:hypothetical protein